MGKALRVLFVEDSEIDAELLLRELKRNGYDVEHERVQTAASMRDALSKRSWDIVLSDYSMPQFSGTAALAVLQQSGKDLPFIIISGAIGEEVAVEALKAGANDFLVKGRLTRLGTSIERELREARAREERIEAERVAEAALREKMRAEAASRAKSDFLAAVSHELRTPLNAIIGFSELLVDGVAGDLTPRQGEYAANVLTSGKHLLTLINEILNLARIEAGRMDLALSPVAIAPLVREVQGTLAPLIDKQALDVSIEIPEGLEDIQADPIRLRQVLYNLLSNAIKFTPPRGRVTLRATSAPDHLVIEVEDTGIGIREEDQPRLFREFERLEDERSAGVEGTGLGLVVTKRLVELHGGSIRVRSERDRGSTFTVCLPWRAAARGIEESPTAPTAGPLDELVRARILAVDDDPLSLRLLREILQRDGHEVLDARDVEEALQILKRDKPGAILTDIRLRGGGGVEILRFVRGDESLRDTPIVATTAQAMRGDRERLLAEGFDGYISKPVDTARLRALVQTLLTARERG
jgi:signal transduction histidine kinase